MIAPEPFFEPRGTPFSEFHRIKALIALGHTVDLVTYPFGRDVEMPGLRVVRCLRPPLVRHVRIGPSWAKVPLDAALAATALRRALSTATTPCTRTKRAASSAWRWRPCSASRISTTCIRACRSSSRTSTFRRSRPLVWGMGRIERLLVRRSRVVIVICQQLVEVVRAIDPLVPDGADRERAGLGRSAGGRRQRVAAGSMGHRAGRARRPLHRDVRSVPGPRSALRRGGTRPRGAARRPLPPRGRPAGPGRGGAAAGAVGRRRRRRALHRPAPVGRDPAVPRCRHRARVATQPRHEHAAEDLPVPPRRAADHRHPAADAHPGARRFGRRPHRGDAGGVRGRHPARRRRSGRGRRHRPSRPRPGRHEYSYEAYLERTRHAYAELFGSGAAQVARGVA